MANKSKKKGYDYEAELVKELNRHHLGAERAWGSNGRALGESEDVDIVFDNGRRWRVQAKRRAKIADYAQVPDGADCVMMRGDRGKTMVVIDLQTFLDML